MNEVVTFDMRVMAAIIAILDDEGCTYDKDTLDIVNRYIEIDCPEEKEVLVAQLLEEAMAQLEFEEEFISLQ